MAVPMLRVGTSVGAIAVAAAKSNAFDERQIALLRSFADQAVIAINNVQLFEAVQTRSKELAESLEYQTAISDVLGVISRSQTDVQPVFDTIAINAAQLCGAQWSRVTRFDGELIHLGAFHNSGDPRSVERVRTLYPRKITSGGIGDKAILTRTSVYVPDINSDADLQSYTTARTLGSRSLLAVPMLRGDVPIGAIAVAAVQPGAFSERQTNLLMAFADQAVIAINNVSLFEEVQARSKDLARSVEELHSLGEVGRTVSSTLDMPKVLQTIARPRRWSISYCGPAFEPFLPCRCCIRVR